MKAFGRKEDVLSALKQRAPMVRPTVSAKVSVSWPILVFSCAFWPVRKVVLAGFQLPITLTTRADPLIGEILNRKNHL